MSRLDPSLEPNGSGLRRIEVITGAGGRRRWSEDEKALAVEESLAPDAVVSQVAHRHGATPQQLFTWRREARRRAEAEGVPPFVPAITENSGAAVRAPAPAPKTEAAAPVVEIEIGETHVWIWRDADIGMATAILRALRTSPGAK
ncbi:transposase [Methylocystis sp. ATCC 49242]|uniref:IS66-like element accessory protein TnpA n=1 Tax=Methylocystis sp. ATCC 49242 TaxID=622637 RepID=UPI0001F886DA|nr:transposase [Methylocystis sp. ATCC 49242]